MSEKTIEIAIAPVERFQRWPAGNRPANSPILVTFYGLLDFYYNVDEPNKGIGEIGFQRADGKHVPTAEVFEDGTSIWSMELAHNAKVDLGVVNAAGQDQQPAQVKYLKNNRPDDFRWMIDMQALGWYPGVKTKDVYAAKLYIRHGTFFTQTRTYYELIQAIKVEPETSPYLRFLPLGKPADVVGDEIGLTGTDKLSLKIDGHEEISLPKNAGKKYEVVFSNICFDDKPHGVVCDFDWWDLHEARRNDFHHHRDALMLSGGPKVSVALVDGQLRPGEHNRGRPHLKSHLLSTYDAPCMGAGYGGSHGP